MLENYGFPSGVCPRYPVLKVAGGRQICSFRYNRGKQYSEYTKNIKEGAEVIDFRREEEYFVFQDPGGKGEMLRRKTEIRFDPLTGESSRVVYDPGLKLTPPDYTEIGEKTKGAKCPFCADNIMRITPKFPPEIAPEGRIKVGESVLFPNLFPYSKHNGVAIFSGQHYVRLLEFTPEMLVNAFRGAHLYLKKVVETDPGVRYASVNWNYLPYSGSSILHPHIQVIVSEQPTNYQARTVKEGEGFYAQHRQNYYQALLEAEKGLQQRLIKSGEQLSWLHAFAPKSHLDFMGIFQDTFSLEQITDEHWKALAHDLVELFRYLDSQGLASFNMLFHVPIRENPADLVHLRLVPRLTIGFLETSDINFFQMLHQEPLSYKVPEEVVQEISRMGIMTG